MSETSGETYLLNTCQLAQPDAETFCRANGGHLVSYLSLEEQQEVEQFFVDEVGQ